jgi:cell division protein FtsQ
MDGRGRLAQPLKRSENARASARATRSRIRSTKFGRICHNLFSPLFACEPRRGLGVAASAALILGAGAFGAVRGEHIPVLQGHWHDICDAGANALGFHIAQITVSGQRQMTPRQVFTVAGLTSTSSLPFFDLADARDRLMANPWIAEASLKKFYPGRLEITVVERDAFALWQNEGKVWVIAADGAILQAYDDPAFSSLPLVVGEGAGKRAKEFLAIIAAEPQIAQNIRAAILVAERRWNLRLKNGVDIRLPESNVSAALQTLLKLDREQNLLARDIVAVDLRLPDRVSVQLSDAAAEARAEALKDKKKAKKGSDA